MDQSFFNEVNGNIPCPMLDAIHHFSSIHCYSVRSEFSENYSQFLVPPQAAALILKKEEDVKGRPFLSKSLEKIYILLFEDKR